MIIKLIIILNVNCLELWNVNQNIELFYLILIIIIYKYDITIYVIFFLHIGFWQIRIIVISTYIFILQLILFR